MYMKYVSNYLIANIVALKKRSQFELLCTAPNEEWLNVASFPPVENSKRLKAITRYTITTQAMSLMYDIIRQ